VEVSGKLAVDTSVRASIETWLDLVSGESYNFSFWVGLPQIELSLAAASLTKATSRIPSAGASTTRAQDFPTTSDMSPINPTEGTFFAVFTPSKVVSYMPIIGLGSGTGNRISLTSSDTGSFGRARMSVISGSSTQVANNTANAEIAPGVTSAVAMAYKANDFAWALNEGTVATDTSGSLPSFTDFDLVYGGAGIGSSFVFDGVFEWGLYYPKRLTNAELTRINQRLLAL